MKLVIDISALDKTRSAVNSITDPTPVASLQNLVFGGSLPLDITFTDSSVQPAAAPSWAGATGYTLVVGLGTLDANALLNYTSTTSFVPQTAGWTGRLALDTYTLKQALIMGVQSGGGGLVNVATDPRARNSLPRWCYFYLQIQVITPDGYPVDYAVLRVQMLNRELPAVVTSSASPSPIYAVLNFPTITGLASAIADSTKLGGLTTAASAIPAGAVAVLNFAVTVNDGAGTHAGLLTLSFQLLSSTHATVAPLWFRPYDYAAGNQVVWRLLSAALDTLPASYNADTGKFHYLGAAGAAGAVTLYADQTGTSAPT